MNIPPQLLQQISTVKGFDLEAFIAAHHSTAPVSIRLHPLKGNTVDTGGWQAVPWCGQGFYLPERPLFTADPLLHAGAYYVQEASSMFLDTVIRQLYPDTDNLRVLDLCAAPGGKSTLLASRLADTALLLSNDVIRSRAAILEENMTRWGYNNTWVSSNDPRDFGRMQAYFDLLVVDAPCSGSGLFRKDEKAIGEWSEANVQLCAERQQRILSDVLPALKKDGYLVYATCSYSPAEDEDILDFLAGEAGLESVPIRYDPSWGIQTTLSPVHKAEGYRFFPGKVKGEGFFIAVLRQPNGTAHFQYPRIRSAQNKKVTAEAAHLLKGGAYCFLENDRKQYTAIQSLHEPDFHFLREYIYLRRAGTLLGEPTAKEWLPEHDIALSTDVHPDCPFIELDWEGALLFLKKEPFALPAGTAKGWHIVRYKGLGLGWVKVLSNRVNNYLPKHWRIRMELDFDALGS